MLSFKILYHSYVYNSKRSGKPCPVSVGDTAAAKAICLARREISFPILPPFGESLRLVSVRGTSMMNTVCQDSSRVWGLIQDPRQNSE